VIGNLISHIGSGQENEMNEALNVLLTLSRQYPRLVRPCLAFIRGILDYLDGFSDSQVRTVFTVFNFLSLGEPDDYIRIVIDKQLFSSVPKYKRMGVIGGVAMLTYVPVQDHGNILSSQAPAMSQVDQVQAVELLEKLYRVTGHATTRSLLYDELSVAVQRGELHFMLVEHLSNHVASEFEGAFLIDMEEGKVPDHEILSGLRPESWLR